MAVVPTLVIMDEPRLPSTGRWEDALSEGGRMSSWLPLLIPSPSCSLCHTSASRRSDRAHELDSRRGCSPPSSARGKRQREEEDQTDGVHTVFADAAREDQVGETPCRTPDSGTGNLESGGSTDGV